jgi:nucleotide-binding universal stress UspA family protein
MGPVTVPHAIEDYDYESLEEAVRLAHEQELTAQAKLLTGDAPKEIVKYAETIDADLIVVGSRGHGAITGTLLGSVSRGILHAAKRPVLIVRETRQPVEAAA